MGEITEHYDRQASRIVRVFDTHVIAIMGHASQPHIVVVVNLLHEPGGYSNVCAWALQSLVRHCRVTVFCEGQVDWGAVDRLFGTCLAQHAMPVVTPAAALLALFRWLPLRLSLLRLMILNRMLRRYLRGRDDVDRVLGLLNEFSPGRTAVQYIHYPLAIYPRPDADLRWYHPAWLLKPYRALAMALGGLERHGIGENRSLANSAWTAAEYRRWYDSEVEVLYPPVPGADVEPPSATGEHFVCLGRIAPEKELLKVLKIIALVRDRHPNVTLTIAGAAADAALVEQLTEHAARHTWLTLATDLRRDQLKSVIEQASFGIHGMLAEHFGITVAELMRAGRPVFVPDDAGPAEIVGQHPGLVYGDTQQAVARIAAALGDVRQRQSLYQFAAKRGQTFSEAHFMQRLRAIALGEP